MTAKKGYIGIDAHARNSVMGWRDGRGKYQGAQRFETSESNLLKHLQDIPAQEKHLTIEEGPWRAGSPGRSCRTRSAS